MTMIRAVLFSFALLFSWGACAQIPLTGAGNSSPGIAVLAFDGGSTNTVTGHTTSANMALPGLTTTLTSDVVVVAIITNGSSITSVTSSHLTFTRETGLTPPLGAGGTRLDIWTAVAAGTLSSEVITINNSAAFTTALAFALNGAKTSAPFDVNGAIPSTTNVLGPSATITTSASNTFAFGLAASTSNNAAAGYTNLNSTALANFLALYYKFSSVTLSASIFDSVNENGSIATAIVKGP